MKTKTNLKKSHQTIEEATGTTEETGIRIFRFRKKKSLQPNMSKNKINNNKNHPQEEEGEGETGYPIT